MNSDEAIECLAEQWCNDAMARDKEYYIRKLLQLRKIIIWDEQYRDTESLWKTAKDMHQRGFSEARQEAARIADQHAAYPHTVEAKLIAKEIRKLRPESDYWA